MSDDASDPADDQSATGPSDADDSWRPAQTPSSHVDRAVEEDGFEWAQPPADHSETQREADDSITVAPDAETAAPDIEPRSAPIVPERPRLEHAVLVALGSLAMVLVIWRLVALLPF